MQCQCRKQGDNDTLSSACGACMQRKQIRTFRGSPLPTPSAAGVAGQKFETGNSVFFWHKFVVHMSDVCAVKKYLNFSEMDQLIVLCLARQWGSRRKIGNLLGRSVGSCE